MAPIIKLKCTEPADNRSSSVLTVHKVASAAQTDTLT